MPPGSGRRRRPRRRLGSRPATPPRARPPRHRGGPGWRARPPPRRPLPGLGLLAAGRVPVGRQPVGRRPRRPGRRLPDPVCPDPAAAIPALGRHRGRHRPAAPPGLVQLSTPSRGPWHVVFAFAIAWNTAYLAFQQTWPRLGLFLALSLASFLWYKGLRRLCPGPIAGSAGGPPEVPGPGVPARRPGVGLAGGPASRPGPGLPLLQRFRVAPRRPPQGGGRLPQGSWRWRWS